MPKLNMWQRLGVVASVLWIIGGGVWQRTADIDNAQRFMSFSYRVCSEGKSLKKDFNFEPCMVEAKKGFDLFLEGSWGNVAIFAFGPVLLGWLLGWLSVRVGRWVLAGRQADDTE